MGRPRRCQVSFEMKRARQRRIRPRNPVAVAPILKKGGTHQKARLGRDQRDLEQAAN